MVWSLDGQPIGKDLLRRKVSLPLPFVVCLLHSCLLKENLFNLGKTIFPCKYPNTKLQFTTSTTTNDRTELHEGNWKISYWDNSKESFDFFFLKMLRKPALKFRSLLSGLAFLLLNTSEVFHCLTYVVHLEHENAYISKKSLRRRHCFGNLGVYSRIILTSIWKDCSVGCVVAAGWRYLRIESNGSVLWT